MSELLKVKLRKIELNGKCDRKCGLTDENLQPEDGMKKQNFKDKLCKLKCLEAGGHTVCLDKNGTPGAENNLQTIPKKINLHLKVKPSLSQDLSMEKISGSAPANQRPALDD